MAVRQKKYPVGSVGYFMAAFESEWRAGQNERLRFNTSNVELWRELLGNIAADNQDVESARALAEEIAMHVAALRLDRIVRGAGRNREQST